MFITIIILLYYGIKGPLYESDSTFLYNFNVDAIQTCSTKFYKIEVDENYDDVKSSSLSIKYVYISIGTRG